MALDASSMGYFHALQTAEYQPYYGQYYNYYDPYYINKLNYQEQNSQGYVLTQLEPSYTYCREGTRENSNLGDNKTEYTKLQAPDPTMISVSTTSLPEDDPASDFKKPESATSSDIINLKSAFSSDSIDHWMKQEEPNSPCKRDFINCQPTDINDSQVQCSDVSTQEENMCKQNVEPEVIQNRHKVKAGRRCSKTGEVKNKSLPDSAVEVMTAWFTSHLDHPYPTQDEKNTMMQAAGITLKQLNHWFNNRRSRSSHTAPKRQKRKLEQQLASLCVDLVTSQGSGQVVQKLSSVIQNNLVSSKKRRK